MLARLVVAVLVGCLVGWQANGWRLTANYEGQLAAAAQEAEAVRLAGEEKQRAAEVAALQRIEDANREAARLERCVAAGAGCGLRVKTIRVPAGPATAGVGEGCSGEAELDPGARPDYFALRAGIVQLEQALKVCVNAPVQPR
ncbi:Bacteriophage lysis protein [compost metagenome]